MPTHDLDIRPVLHRDNPEDARSDFGGDLSTQELTEGRSGLDVSVKAGGVEHVDPSAIPRCTQTTKHGLPCRAYATKTGLCVGHTKTRDARSDEE